MASKKDTARNANKDSLLEIYNRKVLPAVPPEAVFKTEHYAHAFRNTHGKWTGNCPWHCSTSRQSFHVNPQALTWFCWGCHTGGGPLQYWDRIEGGTGHVRGARFIHLLKRLFEIAVVPFPDIRNVHLEEIELWENYKLMQTIVASVCAQELQKPSSSQAVEYLQSRGLTTADAVDFNLGVWPAHANLIAELKRHGVKLPGWLRAPKWSAEQQGSIVIPWYDDFGRPLTLYLAWPGKRDSSRPHKISIPNLKMRNDTSIVAGKMSPLYLDRCLNAGHTTEIVLVEGVFDAMVAQARGDTRVVACVGAQLSGKQIETLQRRNIQQVTIALDPDSAGDKGIESCVLRLSEVDIETAVIPRLPDKTDPDTYIINHGIDEWRELIRKAIPGMEWLIRTTIRQTESDTGVPDIEKAMLDLSQSLQRHGLPHPMANSEMRQLIEELTGWNDEMLAATLAAPVRNASDRSCVLSDHLKLTDNGNAKRIAADHGADTRYCTTTGKWYIWDSGRWTLDTKKAVDARAKTTMEEYIREAAAQTEHPFSDTDKIKAHARKSNSRRAIDDAISLLRSEPGIAFTQSELDSNPQLLNLQNGTYCLASQELRQSRRTDLLTKMANSPLANSAECPTWRQFLEDILPDESIRSFVQRLVGMSLVGCGKEQVLGVLYGTGANGKSTFVNVITEILGDYAYTLPPGTLMKSRNERMKYEVADSVGRRLVVANESDRGAALDEVLVKSLTGTDRINTQRKYRDPFEFSPTFTVIMATNHKPKVVGQDYGIWRRIKLIPFEVQIPPERQDPGLQSKLLTESAGILGWIVEGYSMWRDMGGLNPPPSVEMATEAYRSEEDILAEFLDETCDVSLNDRSISCVKTDLYNAYKSWIEQRGQRPMSFTAFKKTLSERGVSEERTSEARIFRGIRLKPSVNIDDLDLFI